MRLSIVRLMLAVGLVLVGLALGAPDSQRSRFPLGVTTAWAEDCPAEYQNCDGEGPLSAPPGHNGGGGGGGQRRGRPYSCGVDRYECEGSDCDGNEKMGAGINIIRCRFDDNGATRSVHAEGAGNCCWL